MNSSLSERFILAMAELPQFMPYEQTGDDAHIVHVLTGARVSAIPDPDDEAHGLLQLRFPCSSPVQVIGVHYLELQLSEAAAHYQNASGYGEGRIADQARRLHDRLEQKYNL